MLNLRTIPEDYKSFTQVFYYKLSSSKALDTQKSSLPHNFYVKAKHYHDPQAKMI